MLFDKFIEQYIEDLIECSGVEYDITEEDKKDIKNYVCGNDRLWETIDNTIFDYLGHFIKEESEDNE